MSFIVSIGYLMAESGLYDLLDSTLAGVQNMMTGKKFPQNMRALRIVARVSCGVQLSRVHLQTTVMAITPPKVTLTIPDNKHQLIGFIVYDLCSNAVFPVTSNIRRLVVT